MQEQIYTLKNRLAVADDTLKRREETYEAVNESRVGGISSKQRAKYEAEIQELSEAVRTYETEQAKMVEERKYWENKAKVMEQKYAQCLEDVEELDAFNATTQLSAQTKSDQLSRLESELQKSKEKCELLISEVARLNERIQQFEGIQAHQVSLKGELVELEANLTKKDELLKAANKRFLILQKKVESLEKENAGLAKSITGLEQERKKLTEKWQSVIQRTKTDEKLKVRIKELEDLCSQYKLTIEQSNGIVSEWERRYQDAENRCKDLESSLASTNDAHKRLRLQYKLDSNEKDMLAAMNQTLSVKLHRAEEDLRQQYQTTPIDGDAESAKLRIKLNKAISDVAGLQVQLRGKDEEIWRLKGTAGKKMMGTCRGESLGGVLREINAENEEMRELKKQLEKKDEDVRQLKCQCSLLLSKLHQLEKSDLDAHFAQAYELDVSQNLSPHEPKSLSNTLKSLLNERKMRSTSTMRACVAPLEDNPDLGRSKTPTPSQANTTRRCSNPPSPVLNKTESRLDETPKYAVQEVVIGLGASHGKLRLSRRTTSERQQWKT